jgi:hypothetical protein
MNNVKSTSTKSKVRASRLSQKKANGGRVVLLSSAAQMLVAMTDALEDILRFETASTLKRR